LTAGRHRYAGFTLLELLLVLFLLGLVYALSGPVLGAGSGGLSIKTAARQLAAGTDWSGAFVGWLERIPKFFKRGPARMRVEKRPPHNARGTVSDADFNASKKQQQERIDAILDKISRSGYDSLSKAERDFLFRNGNEH